MRRTWRWVAGGALAAVLAGGGLWRMAAGQPSTHLSPAATAALAADGMTPLGGRPAPDFRLIDQHGRPVSLSEFHGKAVVLTFLDPVCWLDCPLQAQEMAAVDRLVGSRLAGRVQLVAVDANPIYHSVADIRRFDRQEQLDRLPNWTFGTSASLPQLQRIWKDYYVDVSVPKNGMVLHSDLFYLIGPHGGERYLSVPDAKAGYVWGTSQLLATYVSRLLGASGRLPAARPSPLPAVANPTSIGLPGPVAVHFASAADGWMVLNTPPYQVVEVTADGGRHWTDVGPPGISKRAGLVWSWAGSGGAWVAVRPYVWMQDTTVYETASGGRNWGTPAVLTGHPAQGSLLPLAAAGGTRAGVLLQSGLWTTGDGGRSWRRSAQLPADTGQTGLSWSPGRIPWLSGTPSRAEQASLWTLPDGAAAAAAAWRSVSLPVPPRFRNMQILTLPPAWGRSGRGGAAALALDGPNTWLWWVATADGGRHWRQALPPVRVERALPGGVEAVGGSVYVLRPAAGGVAVWRGDLAQGRWSQVGSPAALPAALGLDFLDPRHGWIVAQGRDASTLWRTVDGGRTWSVVHLPATHS